MINKIDKKKMVSKVLVELESLLHKAIEDDRVGNLNVFEMIMVSADTLDRAYKIKKEKKKEYTDNVIAFRQKQT